jgi:3-deoxy-manno-octulosonate cytidylyltransferase (CMP-KDO synthetase)
VKFKVVIPARYASTRLPGKPLLHIDGIPMLEHVYLRAQGSGAQQVIIATDDERIKAVAEGFGAQVCMTSSSHTSGSDRLAEVGQRLGWHGETLLVNLQGDEPLMPPENIRQVAENLRKYDLASMTTLCAGIENMSEFNDPNVVKVVRDRDDFALYFSRAPIPLTRGDLPAPEHARPIMAYKHIGLYAYRLEYLATYTAMAHCQLESLEGLEQLRVLYHGDRIHVAQAQMPPGPGVDTERDLIRLRQLFAAGSD